MKIDTLLLSKNVWHWGIPFLLGVGAPIISSGDLGRLLDFGTRFFGTPAIGGLVFGAAAAFAAIRSPLRPLLVALVMFAGIPIGSVIDAGMQAKTFTPELDFPPGQTIFWWAVAIVPTAIGVHFGSAFRTNFVENR